MTKSLDLFKAVKDYELEQVREFQTKFGLLMNDKPTHLTTRKLTERFEFLQEELNEFRHGIATQDMVELADALVDLVYVAKGTALMLGIPWVALWEEVQRANMEKERGVKPSRGHLVDCVKPEGWNPPNIYGLLIAAGYDEASKTDVANHSDDLVHKETNDNDERETRDTGGAVSDPKDQESDLQ